MPRRQRTPGQAREAARAAAARAAGLDKEGRLVVSVSGRNPVDAADEVAAHILAGNDPPRLFSMGLAAVQWDDRGHLAPMDERSGERWALHVARRVTFEAAGKKDTWVVPAPGAVMKLIPPLVTPKLPPLDGIATTPYLTPNGELVAADGYHPGTRLILHCDGLVLPEVPAEPTPGQVADAVKLLTVEWLGDFPFPGDADRAHMVAALLTLTGRMLFPLAPLFVFDASAAGAGKGLLATTVSLIATGQEAAIMMLPDDSEEQRKKITTALMDGRALMVWDEAQVITGRTLAATLTAERYSDRILGGNKMLTVPNLFTMVALGNNVLVRGDLKRRAWPSRLVPDTDHPEKRDGWRHPYLAGWVREHRGELLAAALVIWRRWIAEGRPEADITVGSYEKWARSVGGALAAAGVEGFGANVEEWLSYSDDDADEGWAAYLARLARRYEGRWFTIADVADATTAAHLPRLPGKYDPDKPLAGQVAYAFRGQREKWHGGRCLARSRGRDGETGSYTWQVRERPGAWRPGDLQYVRDLQPGGETAAQEGSAGNEDAPGATEDTPASSVSPVMEPTEDEPPSSMPETPIFSEVSAGRVSRT